MKRILIFVLVFEVFVSSAQAPKAFYTIFGGSGEDVGYNTKQTLDGQYVVVGSSVNDNQNATDMLFVKLDTMGNVLWQKLIGGIGNDVAKSVIQLPDSGFVLTGFTNSFGMGGYDAYTVRTDKVGNMIWQKTFGGLNWDFANDIVQASDGSIIIVGSTESFGSGKKDGFILKYDLSGNMIWQKLIGDSNDDELKAIIKTNDNYLASVGYKSSIANNCDIYFMKLDLNGDTLFTKNIGGLGKDIGNDLIQKANGQYIICGSKTFTNSSYTQSYMYCFNSTGTFTWENNYYSSSKDEEMIALTSSLKNYDHTGYLRNVPVPSFKSQGNIFVGRFGGWPVAVNSFGGYDDETFYSIEATKDGGYISAGRTMNTIGGANDVFFIKTDSMALNYSGVVELIVNKPRERRISVFQKSSKVFKIQFENLEVQTELKVYDLGGSIVKQDSSTNQNPEIDLNELSEGLYIIGIFLHSKPPVFIKIINE